MEITKDGKAESVTVKDDIAARVQIYTDEHGKTRVRCQVLFIGGRSLDEDVIQKTSPGRASDGS